MSDNSVSNILEHLREGFLEDMPLRINKIEEQVMSSESANRYDELFRMVHSLKGSAGSYNFHILTKIAHNMEDVMLSLMQQNEFGTPATVELLLKYIDILRETTDSLISSEPVPLDIDERLDFLRLKIFKDKINILVVEPSRLCQNLVEHSLENISANFTFIDDGLAGLNNLLLNKYDLLITSLECPRLNGDALVAALRLVHNYNKNIKVILVSSREQDKISNKDEFDVILDRKTIKDGGLYKIIENLMGLQSNNS